MYAKDRTTVVDRREMLRVKMKSLTAESRIIRAEERRSCGQLRNELHLHRVGIVRSTARNTHLAYGLIRGRTLLEMEPTHKKETLDPDWDSILKMLKKYGPKNMALPAELQACEIKLAKAA
jgi:hypothetical protein